MTSRRWTNRKKQRMTGVDYGIPKIPWNTATPTREEDKEESVPREAQRVCEEECRKKGENKQRCGTKAPLEPTEDRRATETKRLNKAFYEGMKELEAAQRENLKAMTEIRMRSRIKLPRMFLEFSLPSLHQRARERWERRKAMRYAI